MRKAITAKLVHETNTRGARIKIECQDKLPVIMSIKSSPQSREQQALSGIALHFMLYGWLDRGSCEAVLEAIDGARPDNPAIEFAVLPDGKFVGVLK